MTRCERCGEETRVTIMSRFNTEIICSPCEKLERAHPRYVEAARAELEALNNGDYNYPGIGLPHDLRPVRA